MPVAPSEPPVELIGLRQVSRAGCIELLLPPRDLTGEEPLRPAEIGETDRIRNDHVQVCERVDHACRDRPRPVCAERLQLRSHRIDRALDPLHHVERRAEHLRVVAGGDRAGDPHRLVLDRVEDAELAQHVVGGRRTGVAWRPAQHPPGAPSLDGEDLARTPAEHRREREVVVVAEPPVEEAGERGDLLG
jgi:hypothetical protein